MGLLLNSNPPLPPELEQLYLQTPSARGADGTNRMIVLRTKFYQDVTNAARQAREEFWETAEANTSMTPQVELLREELTNIDEQSIVPRPESISTPKQCDDIIGELNNALARVGRIWIVAHTAYNLCDYEVGLIEKWLRNKFRLEDARNMDAMIGIILQDERRYLKQLEILEDHAERVYKRIETQLPSLRDLSDRRYQESRYHQQHQESV